MSTESTAIRSTPVVSSETKAGGAVADASAADTTAAYSGQAVTTAADNAATGMFDQLYPFITVLSASFLLLAFFMHLRLNQSRYGRSQAHYREIDDFHWRMRHLND